MLRERLSEETRQMKLGRARRILFLARAAALHRRALTMMP